MAAQPRLHIAKIVTTETTFDTMFTASVEAARSHLGSTQFSLASLWDYAQYLDLADAGYGKKTDSLYAMVAGRCRAMLRTHGQSPAVRLLCGKTCALSDMLNENLDIEAGELSPTDDIFSGAQVAA